MGKFIKRNNIFIKKNGFSLFEVMIVLAVGSSLILLISELFVSYTALIYKNKKLTDQNLEYNNFISIFSIDFSKLIHLAKENEGNKLIMKIKNSITGLETVIYEYKPNHNFIRRGTIGPVAENIHRYYQDVSSVNWDIISMKPLCLKIFIVNLYDSSFDVTLCR